MRKAWALIIVCVILLAPWRASAQEEMLIGLVPEENIFKQMDRYRPLAAYLSARLGIKVKLTILSRYGDIIDRFISRKMDGAFFNDFTAVLAVERLSAEPVVRALNLDGTSGVQSYLFARHDSGIKRVKDMKDKRIAFVDKASVSGYLFAVSFLRENGVSDIESYFREHSFTGSHDSAIYSVLDNRADIGTAESKAYYRMIEKDPAIKNELFVIAKSTFFPGVVLCVRKDMPERTKVVLREAFLTMEQDPQGKEVLKKFGAPRFVVAGKNDFIPIFDILRKAGIDIKTYRYK